MASDQHSQPDGGPEVSASLAPSLRNSGAGASSESLPASFATASQAISAPSGMRGSLAGRTPRTGGRQRSDLAYSGRNLRSISFATSEGEIPAESASDEEDLGSQEQNNVWGTDINVPLVKQRLRRFLRHYQEPGEHEAKYLALIRQCCEDSVPVLNVDCRHLHSFDAVLYRQLVDQPAEMTQLLDEQVHLLAQTISTNEDFDIRQLVTKPNNLLETHAIRDLHPKDINKLISISGMITRTSNIIPEIRRAFFKCQKCGREEWKDNVDGRIEEPKRCPDATCRTQWSMCLHHNLSIFYNKQIVKMQENPNAIPEGETPHNVTMLCFDEMVDATKPGDRVTVTGIYVATPVRVHPRICQMKSVFKTHIDILHVRRDEPSSAGAAAPLANQGEEQQGIDPEIPGLDQTHEEIEAKENKLKALAAQEDIYERLVASFAPSIWELDDVKKGLLCLLFGGKSKAIEGGKVRGELNILMVGDPGVAKSQLLSFAHRLSTRGIYTSGRSSSAVGLTAYVTKDPETRERVLESGALVLSDKGVCCIDEFDKMTDATRSMLHEVMEQQTVSIAKAGIIAQLNARTSVLAAANPVGSRYNPRMSIVDNILLPASLLSRFDLIYMLLDRADEENDKKLARHLVSMFYEQTPAAAESIIPLATLKDFIKYAREKCHPELDDEAAEYLVSQYVSMRREGNYTKTITATPRQLESMIRISEALAKMRLADYVEKRDVVEAVRLIKVAMQQAATDPETGLIDMDIIQTGLSRRDRQNREKLAEELVHLLTSVPAGLTREELLQRINDQSEMAVKLPNIISAAELLGEQLSFDGRRYKLKDGATSAFAAS